MIESQTIDKLSKEDAVVNLIKQKPSFKALVESFSSVSEVTPDSISLAFRRYFPKDEESNLIKHSDGSISRDEMPTNVVGDSSDEVKQRVKRQIDTSELVVDKVHKEVYRE